MLSLNETIKDVTTWKNYITEDQGAIPAGLSSAIGYLQTLRSILDQADNRYLRKHIKDLKNYLIQNNYYEEKKHD